MASRQTLQQEFGQVCAHREAVCASQQHNSDCAGSNFRGLAQLAFVLDPRAQDALRT